MTLRSLQPQPFVSLKPHVTRDEAIDAFRPGAIRRSLGGRPLRSIADVYVPYHLFRVEIAERRRQQTSYVAVDALRGMLDPYQFERRLEVADLVTIRSRNRVPATIDVETAPQVAIDGVGRLLFS